MRTSVHYQNCTGNKGRVPHISLVFREMWDTTALSLSALVQPMHLAVSLRDNPNLAKNERDMGHPSFCCRYSFLASTRSLTPH